MSATSIEDCPVVDAARPTTIARPELKAAVAAIESPQLRSTFAPARMVPTRHHPGSAFERYTPLRI
jgi:hypothetical protein